jgi:hypothetical protein
VSAKDNPTIQQEYDLSVREYIIVQALLNEPHVLEIIPDGLISDSPQEWLLLQHLNGIVRVMPFHQLMGLLAFLSLVSSTNYWIQLELIGQSYGGVVDLP